MADHLETFIFVFLDEFCIGYLLGSTSGDAEALRSTTRKIDQKSTYFYTEKPSKMPIYPATPDLGNARSPY